jgi:diguanylate cyclase (GGDEF)-like protein
VAAAQARFSAGLVVASPRDRAVARLHALTEIAKSVTGAASFEDAVRLTAEAARLALDAASLSISVWERDQAHVRVLVNTGDLAPHELPSPTDEIYLVTDYPQLIALFAEGQGFVHHVSPETGSTGSTGSSQHDGVMSDLLNALGKASSLSVPLVLEGRVWGELFVTRDATQEPFEPDDVDYGFAVSAQVAAGIAQGQHLERVARLAYTDALTGLANRRAIDDRLDRAMDSHRADGTVVSLVVVDVNGLKRINDDRGHEAGDRALVHFAGLLAAAAGLVPGSLAGRTGGDEFCVIIEGQTSDHAVRVAEELCRRAGASLAEGIACGVASTGDPVGIVDTPARLFRLADAAQTRAKRSRAKHPVVAGRGLPVDATVRLADAAEHSTRSGSPRGDRRRVRVRPDPFQHVLLDVLATLDHSDATTTRERLEVVADAVTRLVDGCSWWVSRTDDSGELLSTVNYSAIRYGGGSTADPEALGGGMTTFPLADYPVTRAMLEGGGTIVRAADPGAEPHERAILEAAGYSAVVMAGGQDSDEHGWLVEVFVDDISGDVSCLAAVLRSLIACALVAAPGR